MNKQLTHFEAGCAKGQLWQEEQLLGQGGRAGQRGAERECIWVHVYTHMIHERACCEYVLGSWGHLWSQSRQQMGSPDLSSQGLQKHPRGHSCGDQVIKWDLLLRVTAERNAVHPLCGQFLHLWS